ncbi:MAG: NAD(P)-binding protein [Candidatus Lokiarchaeota archaeon]|nr:NAD(P)-binding protein [Candidatus Lokiarchaeota archaeon]
MLYDVIIIGSGFGGLVAGVKLVKTGYSVLILEKNWHIGGTSYNFRRKKYHFPMGPLAISSPDIVLCILNELDIQKEIKFKKSNFQLITPSLDIVYSQSFDKLEALLIRQFKEDRDGIRKFFNVLNEVKPLISDLKDWNPYYTISNDYKNDNAEIRLKIDKIEKFSKISSKDFLYRNLSNEHLIRFLGTMGTGIPKMSMFLLSVMWYLMGEKGIWRPTCGLDGILNAMHDIYLKYGGEIKLNSAVKEILIGDRKVIGVKTAKGVEYRSNWVISNSDYKNTFLGMIDKSHIPSEFLNLIKKINYFGSEFAVYLGIDPGEIDFSKIRADHTFYTRKIKINRNSNDLENFDNREVEICLWSKDDEDLPKYCPEGKVSILLRVGFPYEHFSDWRIGPKKRKNGYKEYKRRLAKKLLKTVETVLPGLSSSIEMLEIATPLTYEDWGNRWRGSIAGWSWASKDLELFDTKLLIRTPIPNLLMAGLYASTELFLGGVPTSMYTGYLAAEIIDKQEV